MTRRARSTATVTRAVALYGWRGLLCPKVCHHFLHWWTLSPSFGGLCGNTPSPMPPFFFYYILFFDGSFTRGEGNGASGEGRRARNGREGGIWGGRSGACPSSATDPRGFLMEDWNKCTARAAAYIGDQKTSPKRRKNRYAGNFCRCRLPAVYIVHCRHNVLYGLTSGSKLVW